MATDSISSGERTHRSTTDETIPAATSRSLRWGSYLLATTGLLFVVQGLGMVYRALVAGRYEPGVSDLGGVTAAELAQTNPAVQSYIDHLAVNVGGLFVVVGIAVVALVWFGVRRGEWWAFGTTLALPLVYAAFGLPIHQTVHFHYDELAHLGPAGVGFPLLIAGAVLAYRGLRSVNREA